MLANFAAVGLEVGKWLMQAARTHPGRARVGKAIHERHP